MSSRTQNTAPGMDAGARAPSKDRIGDVRGTQRDVVSFCASKEEFPVIGDHTFDGLYRLIVSGWCASIE